NVLLATNIHSIGARHLFPCWDEPELKATFQFRFTHLQKYKIWPISVSERSAREDYKRNWLCTNSFIEDKISTYQLMFILTNFEFSIKTKFLAYNALGIYHTVIKLSIASRSRVENSMQVLYDVSNKILHSTWYHKIPLRRNITLLAIPAMKEDVMANWGLIVYEESLVTYDKQLDSYTRQREVVNTVARGIAYQLVEENIVTLPWWSHLWFNKGLAALLHVQILDEVFWEWGFMDLFVVQVHQDCLHLDTNFIMKPLLYEVQTSSEIKSLFSFPIYVKAPVILRMVRHIMGKMFEESIKKSIIYSTYSWDLIQVHTLCGSMDVIDNQELCNYTMKDIMETWITTNNYPIAHVHRNESTLFICQSEEEFYNDNGSKALRHWLPITFTTSEQLDFNNTTPRDWITPENSNRISVRLTHKNEWIILNLQQTGYYRVKYDTNSLKFVTNYLLHENYEKIHVLNRAQIIDDTYYFLMRGEVTYNTFMRLMNYLARDRDYIAWYPMLQIFIDLSYFLPFAESAVIKQDMRYILKKLLSTLSYNEEVDDNDLTMRLRQEAIKWACIFGYTECQHTATDKLKEHLEDPTNRK
ncbi:Aminopeptidase N, partial [Ooceraea biroi]